GGQSAHGVQIDRAVRVVDALRTTGGSGRVPGVGGGRLLDDRPVVGGGLFGDEILVEDDVGQRRLDLVRGLVGHHDPALDVELRRQSLSHGQERLVDEDPVGLRVADDVGEVFRGQAQVELEHGRGDSGNGEVELEVAAGVPVEDPDHRSGADAQFAQSVSQLR